MRTLWFALVFLAGGISHEIRNPLECQCITARRRAEPETARSAARKR